MVFAWPLPLAVFSAAISPATSPSAMLKVAAVPGCPATTRLSSAAQMHTLRMDLEGVGDVEAVETVGCVIEISLRLETRTSNAHSCSRLIATRSLKFIYAL